MFHEVEFLKGESPPRMYSVIKIYIFQMKNVIMILRVRVFEYVDCTFIILQYRFIYLFGYYSEYMEISLGVEIQSLGVSSNGSRVIFQHAHQRRNIFLVRLLNECNIFVWRRRLFLETGT